MQFIDFPVVPAEEGGTKCAIIAAINKGLWSGQIQTDDLGAKPAFVPRRDFGGRSRVPDSN